MHFKNISATPGKVHNCVDIVGALMWVSITSLKGSALKKMYESSPGEVAHLSDKMSSVFNVLYSLETSMDLNFLKMSCRHMCRNITGLSFSVPLTHFHKCT